MGAIFKGLLFAVVGLLGLWIIASFPAMTVAFVAVAIVFMFLVFGKD